MSYKNIFHFLKKFPCLIRNKQKPQKGYLNRKCNECNKYMLSYDERYDAVYCANCNEWLEKNCGSPDCEFCKDRPERPL